MKIAVQLFAVARELIGDDEVTLEVPDGATIAQLRAALAATEPSLAEFLPQMAIAVDETYADEETRLRGDSTVAVIPPVSGG